MIGASTYIEVISVKKLTTQSCIPNVRLGNSSWQNPINRFDVNNDGVVDVLDYTDLQTWIEDNGTGILPSTRDDGELYVDVNGDGYATNRDLELLASYLNDYDPVDRTEPTCFPVSGLSFDRDLIIPSTITTIGQAGLLKNLKRDLYRVFLRDFTSGVLSEVTYGTESLSRDSIVFIAKELFTERSPYLSSCTTDSPIIERVQSILMNTAGILQMRML